MNQISRTKSTLIAIGILPICALGIYSVADQENSRLHTGNSQSDSQKDEGDSNPQPVATVTRYAPAPTPTDVPQGHRTTAPGVDAPAPAHTTYVQGPGPVKTVIIQAPEPTGGDTETATPTG